MSKRHPRFELYPQHEDYYRMFPTYRPFVFWVNEPSYRSKSVNTDDLGLRHNMLPGGRLLDLRRLKESHRVCDIIVGGSTVFGVDASGDASTISACLSSNDVPCINLGNRGAVSIQELQLFLFYRPLFPSIRNIILLSGVNDCSLASLEGSVIFDEFGGLFGQDHYMTYPYMTNLSACYDDRSYDRLRLYNSIERRYRDNGFFRSLVRGVLAMSYKREPMRNQAYDKRAGFERKVERQKAILANQLFIWKSLADAHGSRLQYVLQPCIGWTGKELSHEERTCYEMDLEVYPEMGLYANPDFHSTFAAFIAETCSRLGVGFHDANEAFDGHKGDSTFFTDVCHLTDQANRVVAEYVKSKTS
jgi:hypothetical protein